MPSSTTTLHFSVSNWEHLYSLQQAITRTEEANGKRLNIQGKIRSEALLDNRDTPIRITFYQVDTSPAYSRNRDQRIVLGQMQRTDSGLTTELPVDEQVFEEMRRNLMEYANIEGIHIVVSIGLELPEPNWPLQQCANILTLDYAMRGDA